MKPAIILAALAFMLSGCVATNPPRVVVIDTPFDAALATKRLAKGANTIKGSALMRQQGGGVVTCAGRDAELIPDTPYSALRMAAIYGSASNGFVRVGTPHVAFNPDFTEYRALRRKATCDAQGYFRFGDVADGTFFVITTVAWMAGQYSQQGGGLMLRVEVKGGETKEVVLVP